MIPTKDIMTVNLPISLNCEGKMITAAVIAKQKQMVEGHVKLPEAPRGPELPILLLDLAYRPDDTRTVVGGKSVGLQKEVSKC